MEILVTRRNDLEGMNLPAAPAAALGSFAAFPKAGFAQGSQRTAGEIFNSPSVHRLSLCGIEVHEAGTFTRSSFPNSRRRRHFSWRNRAARAAARLTVYNYCRIKLPLKRACAEDAWMWIPRGWRHPGKRPFLRARIIGYQK